MRRLIENMQRCALRGLPPVPLAIESVTSVLKRWRALLRARIVGRLKELNNDGVQFSATESVEKGHTSKQARGGMDCDMEISEDEDTDETEDYRDDVPREGGAYETAASKDAVNEICDLLNSPDRSSEKGCRKFFGLAHKFGSSEWLVSMDAHNDTKPDGGWNKLFEKALKHCDPTKFPTGGPSPKVLKALQRLVSLLASSRGRMAGA